MAFLIPDNLKSRKDVSDAIRRVARAFAIALDEDVTVWYEPLFDPDGELPHLVVLDPRLGIVVLEVLKGRDKANLLGAVRGRLRIEIDGEEREVDNPLERAERFADALRTRLRAHPSLADVGVGAVAVFSGITEPDARRLGIDRIVDLERCIFKPDLDAALQDANATGLLRTFTKAVGGTRGDELSEDALSELRGIIHPDVVITRRAEQGALFAASSEASTSRSDDPVKVMDRRQEAMAKSLGSGHRVIRGVAGSGKTLVLVARAKLLARLLPSKRILVTCYTRSLASQLRAELAEFPNIEVVNLDKLMARCIAAAHIKHPGYEAGDAVVAQTALQAIRAGNGARYRAVLVDEAQDFGTEALRFCVELLESTRPDEQDLVIVADSAQNIFRKDFRWKDAGISAQGRTRLLRVNYRNTREILEFAHRFLTADPSISVDEVPDPEDEFSIIPAETAERSGPPPVVKVAASPEEEVDLVVETVRQLYSHRRPSRSIAVLHGEQSVDDKVYRPREIVAALRDADIPCFWVTDPKQKANRDLAGSADEPVIVSTIQSAKGLEFPDVVVCGLGVREDELTARKLLYVGFTRAFERLTVVTTKDSPFRDDVEAAADLVPF